jgi:hypothetical protein
MKKPRFEDFDPNALPTLNSPLDGLPVIQPPAPSRQSTAEHPVHDPIPSDTLHLSGSSPFVRTADRTPERPSGRRSITRYAFEFFQDQIDTLRRIALEEKLAGEKGSMSHMVREALDQYITTRTPPAEQPAGRTGVRTEDRK